jgi:hypothetical protein
MAEKFDPKEENLGRNCKWWALGGLATGCCFPKKELDGRRECEGIVDDVCLFIKDGREVLSLSQQLQLVIKTSIPGTVSLPPGETI